MRAIFGPATALVGRLRYAQKFVVVGLVLMVPLGFVAQAYVNLQQSQIELSKRERTGVAFMLPLVELTALVAEARHQVVNLEAHEYVDVEATIARVDRLDARYGETLETGGQWVRIKARLDDAESAQSAPTAFEFYGLAIDSLIRLIVHVGDHSNLTLDPELDTYYLMDALQFQLPAMLDTSGRIVDRALLARRDLSINRTEVAIELGLDNGVLASRRSAIARGLGTAARNSESDEVRRLAGEGFSELSGETQVLVSQVLNANRSRRIQDIGAGAASAVAEGVETAAQIADLRRLGCTVVQGYFLGMPLPSQEAWDTVLAVPQRLLAARV